MTLGKMEVLITILQDSMGMNQADTCGALRIPGNPRARMQPS